MADQAGASYSVEALANTILEYAEQCGVEVGPMKLQKLMYLAHGYYLALTGRPLVDEFFEAWQYGPVVPTIYQFFKQFGGNAIQKGFRVSPGGSNVHFPDEECEKPVVPKKDTAAAKVLDFIFAKYASKTAIYLSDLTHKIGSPWEQTKKQFPNMRNADIQNSLIKTYFEQLVND